MASSLRAAGLTRAAGDLFGDGAAGPDYTGKPYAAAAGLTQPGPAAHALDIPPMLWTVTSTVDGFFPSSLRAELKAIVMALRIAAAPFVYHGDCLGPLRSIWNDQVSRMASARSFHADLYRDIRHHLLDLFGAPSAPEGACVKVKAHQSKQQAVTAGAPLWHWASNRNADLAA